MQPLLPLLNASQFEVLGTIADNLAQKGYHIQQEAFSPDLVEALRNYASNEREDGSFQQAGIGKLQHHQVNRSIRGDRILWVEDDADINPLQPIQDFLEEFRLFLNRTLYLGLRDYEMHLAVYPAGTFYKRHADRFNQQAHRHVSFVFYLNPNWQTGDGGELVIYPPEKPELTINPVGGTLAIFMSELEHEVLPTHVPRYSLTGWMLDVEKGLTFL
jgi:SM-20-related protein